MPCLLVGGSSAHSHSLYSALLRLSCRPGAEDICSELKGRSQVLSLYKCPGTLAFSLVQPLIAARNRPCGYRYWTCRRLRDSHHGT